LIDELLRVDEVRFRRPRFAEYLGGAPQEAFDFIDQ